MNLISVELLAETFIISPLSRTSFPDNKLAESFAAIGYSFNISVVTAIPATDLTCENDIVCVFAPMFVADGAMDCYSCWYIVLFLYNNNMYNIIIQYCAIKYNNNTIYIF